MLQDHRGRKSQGQGLAATAPFVETKNGPAPAAANTGPGRDGRADAGFIARNKDQEGMKPPAARARLEKLLKENRFSR
jgi:hypothetical protein